MSLEVAIDTSKTVLDSLSQLAITSTDTVWLNDTLVVFANCTQENAGGFNWWNLVAWVVIFIAAVTPHYLHIRHEKKVKRRKEKEELLGALTATLSIFKRNSERLNEALENYNKSRKENSFFSVTYRLITVNIDTNILYISQRLTQKYGRDLIEKLVYLYEEHQHINSWFEAIGHEVSVFRELVREMDLNPPKESDEKKVKIYQKKINSEYDMFFINLNGAIKACENVSIETVNMIRTLQEYIKIVEKEIEKIKI